MAAALVSTTTAGEDKKRVQPSRIIPLVVVAPGETKTVLFLVECTVGATRGGGLAVTEMVDGKPAPINLKKEDEKTFRRAGVTVTVPNMTEAPKFDSKLRSGALAALAKVRPVFPVTVTADADADAEPVAIDFNFSTRPAPATATPTSRSSSRRRRRLSHEPFAPNVPSHFDQRGRRSDGVAFMSDERQAEDDVPMETRESTGVANNLQDRMDIPPMLLRDLLIISLFFSGAMVLALTDSIDKAMVYLYFAVILYFGDRFRRIPHRSGPDQLPPVDSRASVKAVAEALLFAAFLIFLVFDAIDSPLQRLLPKAFNNALLAADRALGLVIKPTFHVIVLLGFAIVLFSEWRYWASHALDPRRSLPP